MEGEAEKDAYLRALGTRLRHLRAQRGMTRRLLARQAGVSERYIAQMEGGAGNASILLLRRLAHALGTDIASLAAERAARGVEFALLEQMLARLEPADLAQARRLIAGHFPRLAAPERERRLALIGLRGGGKSTLGEGLARARGIRLVELDREIEREGNMAIHEIFELHGQPGYRRLEQAALTRLIATGEPMVIATGGSLVTEPGTFELLLRHCLTVWVRAAPEAHMQRVIDQGDVRPMAENRSAMEDLHAILASRSPLYAKADFSIDTTGETPDRTLTRLTALIAAETATRFSSSE